MTGLISSPAPLPDPEDASVAADGWFPPITVASVRDRVRIGGAAVTHDMLVEAIEGGMLHAFRELSAWRSAHAVAGAAKLADVTGDELNGRNRAVVLWERVVRYFAAAELFAGNPDISATVQGSERGEEKVSAADEHRRNALAAVADLRSVGALEEVARNRVELI